MSFRKKIWKNRVSEYPNRRKLTQVSTGVVDVYKAEGGIFEEGTKLNDVNLNDLESRICDAVDTIDIELEKKAPLTSPSFSGIPTVPSAPSADKSIRIANTAFVASHIAQTNTQLITHEKDTIKHITTIERNKWNDKYTKIEVDNKLSMLETNTDWKEAVATFSAIATTYPTPQDGWTVNVNDTDYTYRYNGSTWIPISANAIPKATTALDGLQTKESVAAVSANTLARHTHSNKALLDTYAQTEANVKYAVEQRHTHSNKAVIDGISSTLVTAWNSAASHILDGIKHITAAERTLWNSVATKVDKVSGKQLSTEDYTAAEKTKLSGIATNANNYSLPIVQGTGTSTTSVMSQKAVTDAVSYSGGGDMLKSVYDTNNNGMVDKSDNALKLGDKTALEYQLKSDSTLATTSKTVVGAINEIKTNSTGISTYTHTKSGTAHTLTGAGENIKFTATARYLYGDTFTINGVSKSVKNIIGFKTGDEILCLAKTSYLDFNQHIDNVVQLWSNGSHTSSFPAQTLDVNTEIWFPLYLIVYVRTASSSPVYYSAIIPQSIPCEIMARVGSTGMVSRRVSADSRVITFENGRNQSDTASATSCVPVYIYGIRGEN